MTWVPGLSFAQATNGDEFTFVRFKYTSGGTNFQYRNPFGSDWVWWAVDYPSAEQNFMEGLRNWTALNVADDPVSLSFLDSEIFDYAFAYAVEVGYMMLSQEEADNLREWLLRGGFLMVDDFHGPFEWHNFVEQMKKVFPDRSIKDIPLDHPIFHCFYDFDEFVQVPGLGSWLRGRTFEKGGINQRCMGIFDDQARLMVLVMRNVDLGDAWEHAKDPRYPPYYAAEAFKLGINFIIYALTH
ncbi:DUF4159 domain-containing protein [candidate division KSB1 bacterium]|nr:DUF4159 domain-containing protein [candidate division KSB1 bacterium]NIS23171.1 DUF4159 domain-containing protein [candidate division KSB1 bacterium]NIU23668.1 DUF4159 domain-containing protein [candidate division KSB1 bacterium]NIU91426.1 DUF4159 domain-containing protein [candidate division KSB1 bacterium]NIV93894.1 DUF4159 domain-containing protein [candidate division KSB1 bacterium]